MSAPLPPSSRLSPVVPVMLLASYPLKETAALLILPPLWYLVAWDPSRGGFRHFRMDRISGPELVEGKPFRRRHVPFEADVCPYAELEQRLAARPLPV